MTYEIHRDGETKTFEDREAYEDVCRLLDDGDVEYDTDIVEDCAICGERVSIADAKSGPGGNPIHAECYEGESEATDGGTAVVDESPTDNTEPAETQSEAIPEPSTLTSDSLEVISKNADHFTDTIKGKVVINRQGYAVLAERFDISVIAEPVTLPSETENQYAEFRAVATTAGGNEYSGFGSAHVERGDDATLLAELAETRAMKRSCAWSTGVGMTAVSELENDL